MSKEEYRNAMELDKATDYLEDFFIDYVIWPEELLTQEIFRIVTVAHALDVENFADGKARLLEYKVRQNILPYLHSSTLLNNLSNCWELPVNMTSR